jgi:hypothetical protein
MPGRPRTVVDLARIRAALDVIGDFNRLDLADVDFVDAGNPFPVPPETIGEFRFTGLCNKDFVELEFWNAMPAPE